MVRWIGDGLVKRIIYCLLTASVREFLLIDQLEGLFYFRRSPVMSRSICGTSDIDRPCRWEYQVMRRNLTSDRIRICSVAAGLALVGFLGTELAAGVARTLRFPADRSVGVLKVRPVGVNGWDVSQFYLGWHVLRPARGDVIVPEGHEVKLEAAASAFDDSSFLSSFDPDAIQWLEAARSARIDVPALRAIAKLRGLRSLSLSQCQVADESLGELGSLPRLELVDLMFPGAARRRAGAARERRRSGQGQSLVKGMKWLASLPELKGLQLDGWQLPDTSIEALARCRNLESLTLTIAVLNDQHVRSLASLPHLRSLRVRAESEEKIGPSFAPFRTSRSLNTLVIWGMGVDAAMLHRLSEIASLRKLDLALAELADDALPALQSLKQIDELSLPHHMPQTARSQLVEVLIKLPNIRVWPAVGVDDHALDQIANAVWIESLELGYSRNGKPPSAKQFSKLRQLKNLRELRVQLLPFDDQCLASLAELKSLTSLSLENTQVSGEGFHFLKDLPRLNKVDIYIPEGIQPRLASLAELHHVNNLMVGTPELSVPDFAWLAKMPQLTRLQIIRGLIDDRTAAHLAGLKEVENLWLDDALLSDDGLRPLLGLKNVVRLQVGGFLTDKGILQLAALPRLQSLLIGSNNITEAGLQELKKRSLSPLLNVNRTRMKPAGRELVIDKNGFWRTGDADTRRQLDPLEGRLAPALSVHDWYGTHGRTLSLNELRDKVVLLDFWGVWCGGCVAALPDLQRIREKYRDQGFEIIGVHTTQDAEQMAPFAGERKLSWPNAVDTSKKTCADYHANGLPALYLVDRRGILRIAKPHPYQLEEQIRRLLAEPIARIPN
jgi:thiol-disulfide isomerase/thioredoxin